MESETVRTGRLLKEAAARGESLLPSKANEKQEGGTHYKGKPIEHWDFVLMHEIPYMEAQIIKYVMRWKKKNGMADLYKAQHFLEKLIEHRLAHAKEVVDVCSGAIRSEIEADKEWANTQTVTKPAPGTLEAARAALDGNIEECYEYLGPENTYMNPDGTQGTAPGEVLRGSNAYNEEDKITFVESGEPQAKGYVDQD